MTPIAIVFLVLSIVVIWGGFAASAVFLARRPSRTEYPAGGGDDSDAGAPVIRDT